MYEKSMQTRTTHLTGSKYKLAHKSVSSSWSIPTIQGQRERELELLDDAMRRVRGLPPVLASEKVKGEKRLEQGQQRLDTLFGKAKRDSSVRGSEKPRKRQKM